MREANRAAEIQTTLWELANTIREVSNSDEEAFAVLEALLAAGRVSVRAVTGLSPA